MKNNEKWLFILLSSIAVVAALVTLLAIRPKAEKSH
jgi:hypothetical protein